MSVAESSQARPDPVELFKAYADVAQRATALFADYSRRYAEQHSGAAIDEFGVGRAFAELATQMMSNPFRLAETQVRLMNDYAKLWQNSMLKMWGVQVEPLATPAESDWRFKHDDWQNHFLFDYIKQSYLIAAKHLHATVTSVEGLPESSKKKVDFYTRQMIDAMSPRNFALTNPEVLRETAASHGQNLIKGFSNLLDDLERGEGQLKISMTDQTAFKLGENVATTPGKVVHQTDMMQLIQFDPSTPQVHKRPLVIFPPWINKYYILDLRAKNSFIKWAVDQGHTVFVVSWVNPDERYADKTFDDYVRDGAVAAIDAVEKATGEKEINAIGYCLGGTLLGSSLAYLAAKGDKRVVSATFFVALLDFREPGDLGVFIDEQQLQALEKRMNERGFLDGSEMAGTFNLLRANDLIWSFVVNNYLMGKDPFPFDLLYWNSDSTRMPAKMHSYYLRNMYQRNLLREPGGITLCNTPIDLSKIKIPACWISAIEDHIAPWRSTYYGTQLLAGKNKFILAGSGHIAGIVNPPAAKKYGYWTNDALPADPEQWLEGATQHQGSWWTHWNEWVTGLGGGKMVAARVPGDGRLQVIEPAPGSYVSVKV